jgi:DNA repair protein RadC
MNYPHQGPIHSWALEDRPREKLLQRGLNALTDAELLAIILRSGTKSLSALDLARNIIREFDDLEKLARTNLEELLTINGIGKAKAMSILAIFELARRKNSIVSEKLRITSSSVAAKYLMAKLGDENQEVFYVLYLNRNNEVIGEKQLFVGGVNATVIDPRLVFQTSIQQLASAIIICHNHPSGNLTPSQADIQITHKLYRGANVLDIRLLDHLIVSAKGYFSFADEGMLIPNE